jgi:hypothetical protein
MGPLGANRNYTFSKITHINIKLQKDLNLQQSDWLIKQLQLFNLLINFGSNQINLIITTD